jgi:hypothetical protein
MQFLFIVSTTTVHDNSLQQPVIGLRLRDAYVTGLGA